MEWSTSPKYTGARKRLIDRFRAPAFRFRHLRPVVFLCGKSGSPSRDALRDYLNARHPDLFVFYAEFVWKHIQHLNERNALEMENELAALADILIIIIESAGTIAELGAFSVSSDLRQKLLPILDLHHEHDESFIKTGPVRWVNDDSRFGPAIYCKLDPILTSVGEVEKRLDRIPDRGPVRHFSKISDIASRPKHLLFLIADIVAVAGPLDIDETAVIVEEIVGARPTWSIASLLALAVELRLLRKIDSDGGSFFYRPLENGRLVTFQRRKVIDLAAVRAEFISALQGIPAARAMLALTAEC